MEKLSHILRAGIMLLAMISAAGCLQGLVEEEDAGDLENRHYELPVIFHVLYTDITDPLEFVSQNRFSELISAANARYKGASSSSADMGVSFRLAEKDGNGNTLRTPGVEYIRWSGEYPIDPQAFMTDTSGEYADLLWNPNEYINVMVYEFLQTDAGSITLGISHIPFSTSGSTYLEGLTETEYQALGKENLNFPYCVSINSRYIYRQTSSGIYDSADAGVTLSHELGHFLGLLHVFLDEGETGDDSDFCDDTPCYYYQEYMAEMESMIASGIRDFETLAGRTSIHGGRFTSHNIMDYSFSYSDQFTEDQKERVRHVLLYSPLIPGPKISTRTVAAPEGIADLTIRTMERSVPVCQ